MKSAVVVLLSALAPGLLFGQALPPMPAAEAVREALKAQAPVEAPEAAATQASAPQRWEYARTSLDWFGSWLTVRDWSLGINVSGSKWHDSVSLSGDIAGNASPLFVGNPDAGIRLDGSGVSLTMHSNGGSHWISGSVVGESGRMESMSVNLYQAGDGWHVSADGANLQIRREGTDRWAIDGSIETSRFGKKKLAAVAACFGSWLGLRTRPSPAPAS